MSSIQLRTEPAAAAPLANHRWPGGIWIVALGAGLWLLLFRTLATHWSLGPQYTYGWLVPILVLYALFGRWKTRPAPGAPTFLGPMLAALGALAFLPTWLLLQPNPDWRLLSWALTAEVIAITSGAILCLGGFAWGKHFIFPLGLMFTAVPWPRPWEIPLVERLTSWVTRVSVEALNLTGISSVQQGNLIELRAGLLGVEEACSGIRSLQATLMIALFLGEVFRLNIPRRVLLLLFGIAAALATNVARTYALARVASDRGLEAVAVWHDRAADLALAGCFLIVWIFATLLSRPAPPRSAGHHVSPAHPLPVNLVRALTGWILSALLITEWWFYDPGKNLAPRWRFVPAAGSKPVPITAGVVSQLQFDRGAAASWDEPGGKQWLLYYFEWKPGPPRSRLLARAHHPQNCLAAAGMNMRTDRGFISVSTPEAPLRFRAFIFEAEGRTLYVYHCVHENRATRAEQQGSLDESIIKASLQAVAWRERNLGQQVVEFAAHGYASAGEADVALAKNVKRLIRSNLRP